MNIYFKEKYMKQRNSSLKKKLEVYVQYFNRKNIRIKVKI
jgi:hypothetical protein